MKNFKVFKWIWGFWHSSKRSFKPSQEDFHEWKEKLMKSRGVIWRKKGEKMKVSYEWEKRKK